MISVIKEVLILLSRGLEELKEQQTFTSNNQALKVLSRIISNPYNSKQLFLCSLCLLIGYATCDSHAIIVVVMMCLI